MPRPLNKLSQLQISRALKRRCTLNDGGGLYFVSRPPNGASWIFRFSRHGRDRWMGVGQYPTVALKDARARATDARRLLIDDVDPIENRRQQRAQTKFQLVRQTTFAQCAALNLREKLWTIPAERMKAGKEHRVPLSPRAVEILEAVRPGPSETDGYVFPGNKAKKHLSNMAFLMLLRRMEKPHDPLDQKAKAAAVPGGVFAAHTGGASRRTGLCDGRRSVRDRRAGLFRGSLIFRNLAARDIDHEFGELGRVLGVICAARGFSRPIARRPPQR
jgi:hypothetical protein